MVVESCKESIFEVDTQVRGLEEIVTELHRWVFDRPDDDACNLQCVMLGA